MLSIGRALVTLTAVGLLTSCAADESSDSPGDCVFGVVYQGHEYRAIIGKAQATGAKLSEPATLARCEDEDLPGDDAASTYEARRIRNVAPRWAIAVQSGADELYLARVDADLPASVATRLELN